ncbi:MAG TPA: hypothetical protein VH141_14980, partial [Pseudonocardia sp.]|nr:hypothetical protein [Pseudonocardia sp.]
LLDDGALFVYGLTYLWANGSTLTAGIVTGAAVTALAVLAWSIQKHAPPANPRPSDRVAFAVLATSLGTSLGAGLGALALGWGYPAAVAVVVGTQLTVLGIARAIDWFNTPDRRWAGIVVAGSTIAVVTGIVAGWIALVGAGVVGPVAMLTRGGIGAFRATKFGLRLDAALARSKTAVAILTGVVSVVALTRFTSIFTNTLDLLPFSNGWLVFTMGGLFAAAHLGLVVRFNLTQLGNLTTTPKTLSNGWKSFWSWLGVIGPSAMVSGLGVMLYSLATTPATAGALVTMLATATASSMALGVTYQTWHLGREGLRGKPANARYEKLGLLLDDGALLVYGLTYLWAGANTLTAGIVTAAAVTALAVLTWAIPKRGPPANPHPTDRTAFAILAASLATSLGVGLGAIALGSSYPVAVTAVVGTQLAVLGIARAADWLRGRPTLRRLIVRILLVTGVIVGLLVLASLPASAGASQSHPAQARVATSANATAHEPLPVGRSVAVRTPTTTPTTPTTPATPATTTATPKESAFTGAPHDTVGTALAGLHSTVSGQRVDFADLNAANGNRFTGPEQSIAGVSVQAPADWSGVWTTQPGDSLWRIFVQRFRDLAGWRTAAGRAATPDLIYPGQDYRIQAAPPSTPTPPTQPGNPGQHGNPGQSSQPPTSSGSPAPTAIPTSPATTPATPKNPTAPHPGRGPPWWVWVGGLAALGAALTAALTTALHLFGGRLAGAGSGAMRALADRFEALAGAGRKVHERAADRVERIYPVGATLRWRLTVAAGVGFGFGGWLVVAGMFGTAGAVVGGVLAGTAVATFARAVWARSPSLTGLAAALERSGTYRAAARTAAGVVVGVAVALAVRDWAGVVGWLASGTALEIATTLVTASASALLTFRYVLYRQVDNLSRGMDRNPVADATRSAALAFLISAGYKVFGLLDPHGFVASALGALVFGASVAVLSSVVQRKDTGRSRGAKAIIAGALAGPVAALGVALGGQFAGLGSFAASALGAMLAVSGNTTVADYAAVAYQRWRLARSKRWSLAELVRPRAQRWGEGPLGTVGRWAGALADWLFGAPRPAALERRTTIDPLLLPWKSMDSVIAALIGAIMHPWFSDADTPGRLVGRALVAGAVLYLTTHARDYVEHVKKFFGYSSKRKLREPRRAGLVRATLAALLYGLRHGDGWRWLAAPRQALRVRQLTDRLGELLAHTGVTIDADVPLPIGSSQRRQWANALARLLANLLDTEIETHPWWAAFLDEHPGLVDDRLRREFEALRASRQAQHRRAGARAVLVLADYQDLLLRLAAVLRAQQRPEDARLLEFLVRLVRQLARQPRILALAVPDGFTAQTWAAELAGLTPEQRGRRLVVELARELDRRQVERAAQHALELRILEMLTDNYPVGADQEQLRRALQARLELEVALVNEGQRTANLDSNGRLAATFDPLSAVAELFDQRGRSVRDTAGPDTPLRAALGLLEATADLFGELTLSHAGRADQREQWRRALDTAIDTAINTAPAGRGWTPLRALWTVIGWDEPITSAGLAAQFGQSEAWWDGVLAGWAELGALSATDGGTYRVGAELRGLWDAAGFRPRHAARVNATALPGGQALAPLTQPDRDPTDPAARAAYRALLDVLDTAATLRRHWREGIVDDVVVRAARYLGDLRLRLRPTWLGGARDGRVNAFPALARPGPARRARAHLAAETRKALGRHRAVRAERAPLRDLVRAALAATGEVRRPRDRRPGARATSAQVADWRAELRRARSREAEAYRELAVGYTEASGRLKGADVYRDRQEALLRRTKQVLDAGPGGDPVQHGVTRRLRTVRGELSTALRALRRLEPGDTEGRRNALLAAQRALERHRTVRESARGAQHHQTFGGWWWMERARRASLALRLAYHGELSNGPVAIVVGAPADPVIPAPDHLTGDDRLHAPGAAGATSRGRGNDVMQDALALTGDAGLIDAVLTDGLSNATDSARAAYHSARIGLAMLGRLRTDEPVRALTRAYRAGGRWIRQRLGWGWRSASWDPVGGRYANPPATTWLGVRVHRVATGATVSHVGVGDADLHWLPTPGTSTGTSTGTGTGTARTLTVQHTVRYDPTAADPSAGDTLYRWLAPDHEPVPGSGTTAVTGPGLIIIATDGLGNQLDLPTIVATLSDAAYTDPDLAIDELTAAARGRNPDDDLSIIAIVVPGP